MHTEVICAFLDDEPFNAEELLDALTTADGRSFLVDAIALRRLTRASGDGATAVPPRPRIARRVALVAAVIVVTLASFQLGHRQGLNASVRAPEPTRVVSGGSAWLEDSVPGGAR
jgi:hypothetical protein